jgi:hypothetical protein
MSISLPRWGNRAVVLIVALLVSSTTPVRAAPDIAEDFKILPADVSVIDIIRMDRLLSSDCFKKLLKELPQLENEIEQTFRSEFGVAPKMIERVTTGISVKSKMSITVVRLQMPVKEDDIRAARSAPRTKGDPETKFKAEKIGTATVFVPDNETISSFCLIDDRTLVVGRSRELKAVLEPGRKPGIAADLQAAYKLADSDAILTVLFDVKSLTTGENLVLPGIDARKIVNNTNGALLTVKAGTDVTLRVAANCKDNEAAQEVKKAADAGLRSVAELLGPADPTVRELPRQVKTSVKGNIAQATLAIKDDVVIMLIKTSGVVPRSGQRRF